MLVITWCGMVWGFSGGHGRSGEKYFHIHMYTYMRVSAQLSPVWWALLKMLFIFFALLIFVKLEVNSFFVVVTLRAEKLPLNRQFEANFIKCIQMAIKKSIRKLIINWLIDMTISINWLHSVIHGKAEKNCLNSFSRWVGPVAGPQYIFMCKFS